MGRHESRSTPRKSRRDGWTPERQLAFLAELGRSRSVSNAAAAVGMSREGSYRLRDRAELFAALWDRAVQPDYGGDGEMHTDALANGRLMRLLGTHFRRQWGNFRTSGSTGAGGRDE